MITPKFPDEDNYGRRHAESKEVEYVVRNPNFIELDNITELSHHFVYLKLYRLILLESVLAKRECITGREDGPNRLILPNSNST